MDLCEVIGQVMTYRHLSQNVLICKEACFSWLQEQGLVPRNPDCSICSDTMKTKFNGENSVCFRCRKTSNKHDVSINALQNTFFEGSKFGLMKIVTVMYFFSLNQINYDFLIRETSDGVKTSRETICDWLSYCREVCMFHLDNSYQDHEDREALGGDGMVVEIDECKIGRMKYNKGRLVEGKWILGIIEMNVDIEGKGQEKRGGRYRMEICPDNKRDAQTLIPIILKHVKPGTIIVTDMWKSYFGLTNKGYNLFKVNHGQNFIDPMKLTKMQMIESSWWCVKKSLKTGIRSDCMASYLAEHLYKWEVKLSGVDPFRAFIYAAKMLYLCQG